MLPSFQWNLGPAFLRFLEFSTGFVPQIVREDSLSLLLSETEYWMESDRIN